MASRSVGDRRWWVLVASVVAGGSGCFVGSAAKGLPCEGDLDCGLDDRCIEGFCGGPSATATSLDTSTGTTTGPEPSTGELLCDGLPGAQCQPAMMGVHQADCDGDCTLPTCGDGVFNGTAINDGVVPAQGNEECDEGVQGTRQDAVACDFDCTLPLCGDAYHNPVAEDCDDDDDDDFDGCTAGCQVPVLAERFTTEAWTSEPYDLSDYDDTTWNVVGRDTNTTGWVWADGTWSSGVIPYRDDNFQFFQYNYSGVTRLVSPSFDLPAAADIPEGFTLQLRFWHSLVVEAACTQDPDQDRDGGVVRLREGAQAPRLDAPGYGDLSSACNGTPVDVQPTGPGPEDIPRLSNPLFADERGPEAFTGPT